jgi:hypothetical protein
VALRIYGIKNPSKSVINQIKKTYFQETSFKKSPEASADSEKYTTKKMKMAGQKMQGSAWRKRRLENSVA